MDRVVEVENLSFCYADGHWALHDVNLTMTRGETVALIGPNGAGKSTLLLHLNGILKGKGMVKIFGLPVEERHLKRIRGQVGLVFQNPDDQLFSPTVFDDVAFGPLNMGLAAGEVQQLVVQALDQVGMSGCKARSPHHLSIGEKKRVAIATVLSMCPQLLVIDEPTSSLDPRGRWTIIELLSNLPLTRVIATHDLDMVRTVCARTIVLDGGRVMADGPTDLILADVPLLQRHGLLHPDRFPLYATVERAARAAPPSFSTVFGGPPLRGNL
ncbi:MAG: ATP-binding cassette domain-containing protein [Chloroflexi bacterium]|nr:ATP-binding cassette domain-containing protein [Chloroflexota bacterium]